MPAPLIAAGAGAARGGAAPVRGASSFVGITKKRSLLKRIASFRIVWVAAAFDLWQLLLGLMIVPLMGAVETAESVSTFSAPLVGNVQVAIGALLSFFVAETVVYVGVGAAVGLWFITTLSIVFGYFCCGLAFKLQGTQIVGEVKAGAKLPLLILCLTFDYLFFVGALFPGLTLWAWYLAVNPE